MENTYYFSKTHTNIAKACAILLMLWHHLFAYQPTSIYYSHIIGNIEIEKLIGLFANICVPLFLFLSAYGLNQVNQQKKITYSSVLKRTLSIYKTYWIIIVLFFLPYILYTNTFSLKLFILDFLGLTAHYNGHWWFLCLYVECLLLFPILTQLNRNLRISIFIFILLFIAKLLGKFYIDPHCENGSSIILKHISYLLTYLVVFWTGLMFSKYKLFEQIKNWTSKHQILSNYSGKIIMVFLLIFMVLSRNFLPQFGLFYILYTPILVFCFSELFFESKLLLFIATHSTNMWLLHHLFIDLNGMMIYQLKYPVLIYLVLVIVTIIGSSIAIFFQKSITSVYRKIVIN